MANLEDETNNFTFFWLIPNIFSLKNNIVFRSSEFAIDILNDTTFFLTLEFSKKEKMVALTLKRLFKGDLPLKIHSVKYKFSLTDPHSACDMESAWKEVNHAEHLANAIQVFCIPKKVLDTAEESEKTIMVKYEIRLNAIQNEKYLQGKNRNLRILSKDFSRMLAEGHFYDLIFIVGSVHFKVHRFILQLRAFNFYKTLRADYEDRILVRCIKEMEAPHFEALLHFFYSGMLQDGSNISQWKVIDYLHRNYFILFEGQKYLLSNGCIAESCIHSENIFFAWSLDMTSLNLSFLPSLRLLRTNHLHNEAFMFSVWETTNIFQEVWLRASIQVTDLRPNSILYTRCKIGFLDANMKLVDCVEAFHSFNSNSGFILPPIIRCDEITKRNLIVNGVLKIVFKIFAFQDTKIYSSYPIKPANKLLHDMLHLQETKLRWDLKLVSSREVLFCHRPVLMARSPVFRYALMDERLQFLSYPVKELYFDDTNASALPQFLNYLYTGELGSYKHKYYIKLYNLANIYQIHELKKLCMDSLISGLKLKNALELIEIASKYSDNDMKNQILKFIYSRYKQFVHSNEFAKGVKEKPDLIIEIARNFIPKPNSGYVSL